MAGPLQKTHLNSSPLLPAVKSSADSTSNNLKIDVGTSRFYTAANTMFNAFEQLSEEALHQGEQRALTILYNGAYNTWAEKDLTRMQQHFGSMIMDDNAGIHDARTKFAIIELLDAAINKSVAFQNVVSYALNYDDHNLFENVVIEELTSDVEQASNPSAAKDVPTLNSKALSGNRDDACPSSAEVTTWSTIYVRKAPPPNSPEMDAWRSELMHRIMRVVTGACDPTREESTRSAAKVLTHVIANELGWHIPEHMTSWAPKHHRLTAYTNSHQGTVNKLPALVGSELSNEENPKNPTAAKFPENTGELRNNMAFNDREFEKVNEIDQEILDRMVNQLTTMNSWNGQHGDLVPMLVLKLFPDLDLQIVIKSQSGISAINFRDENHHTKLRPVTLTLDVDRQHYVVGQPYDVIYDPPADGNCFYASLLYGYHKYTIDPKDMEKPVESLRRAVAEVLESNFETYKPYIVRNEVD